MPVSSIIESLRERIPKSIVMNQIVGITLPDKYYDDIKQVLFEESPTILEKLGLEIINLFKEADEKAEKFLIMDSLSTLMVYNDPDIVTKFFYYLVNVTRSRSIHSAYLVIEEEEADKQIRKLINLTDKIEKIVDSFI